MVDGEELIPTGEIKLPSLVNGNFHPYISNYKKAYEELKPIIDETDSTSYVLYITTVYNEVLSRIEEIKLETFINGVALMLSILILFSLFVIDRKEYFSTNGQIISVLHLLGYDFKAIHKNKIFKNLLSYLISMFLFVFIVFVTFRFNQFGFFTPKGGWTIKKLAIGSIIGIFTLSFCFVIEIGSLKKSEREIVKSLKEGV